MCIHLRMLVSNTISISDDVPVGILIRVTLLEQDSLTLPNHQSSLSLFSGVRVIRCLIYCVVFSRSLFVLCSFKYGHCVFGSSSIYGLSIWYLQTFLTSYDGRHIWNCTVCIARSLVLCVLLCIQLFVYHLYVFFWLLSGLCFFNL